MRRCVKENKCNEITVRGKKERFRQEQKSTVNRRENKLEKQRQELRKKGIEEGQRGDRDRRNTKYNETH